MKLLTVYNSIQIMTDHEGNREIYLARGIQEGLKTVDPLGQ